MAWDRLLALDLDGTLLRTDGTIDPRDLAAIRRVRAEGCAVTIATGRVTATTIHVARALGLDVPLVCADGRILAHPGTGATIELFAVPQHAAALALLKAHALVPVQVTPTYVVHEPEVVADVAWLGAAPELRACDCIDDAACDDAVMLLGLGERDAAHRASTAIGARLEGATQVDVYRIADGPHAVRVWAPGHDKQSLLARVAAQLGIAAARVATVGDWYNDIAMLRWAGRSFAMGGAPAEVGDAASDRLVARAGEGGGVAEAIERWR